MMLPSIFPSSPLLALPGPSQQVLTHTEAGMQAGARYAQRLTARCLTSRIASRCSPAASPARPRRSRLSQCLPSTRCAGGYAWISAADTSLLDFPHCELLLIGAKPDTQGTPRAAHQPAFRYRI